MLDATISNRITTRGSLRVVSVMCHEDKFVVNEELKNRYEEFTLLFVENEEFPLLFLKNKFTSSTRCLIET